MPEIRVEIAPSAPPRLLDRVREAIRVRHYSPRTEKAYIFWIRRFVLFHGKRHPDVMGEPEIAAFLANLATRARVSATSQNQAFSALLFLYRRVLNRLRLQEALQLRVKDIDLDSLEIVAPISPASAASTRTMRARVRYPSLFRTPSHESTQRDQRMDLAMGLPRLQNLSAPREPLPIPPPPPRNGRSARVQDRPSPLRHSQSGELPLTSAFLRHTPAIQELLGHADVSTTMIYTHVLNRGWRGVVSPFEHLPQYGQYPNTCEDWGRRLDPIHERGV